MLDLVPDPPGELVEVGVWEGNSLLLLAQHFPGEQVHAIDPWYGCGDGTQPSRGIDVYADFVENMRENNIEDRVIVWREDSRDVFARWETPIRYLYIDGEHTYDAVADNLIKALPHMVPNGVICGDDFAAFPEIAEACLDVLGKVLRMKNPTGAEEQIWWWVNETKGAKE